MGTLNIWQVQPIISDLKEGWVAGTTGISVGKEKGRHIRE